jgi:hypothetical protein
MRYLFSRAFLLTIFTMALVSPARSISATSTPIRSAVRPQTPGHDAVSTWGLLANNGFAQHGMKGVYFFAGDWRCCRWQPWFAIDSLTNILPGTTVTAVWANTELLDLFVAGADGVVYHTAWNITHGWQRWTSIHPEIKASPGAVISAVWANADQFDLFMVGADGIVYTAVWEAASGWSTWSPIHPESKAVPGATVTAAHSSAGQLDLLVSGADGTVYHTVWEAALGWRPWEAIHAETRARPGATITAVWANASHLDLFMAGADGTVYTSWWEAALDWQAWVAIHPETKAGPGATITAVWANTNHLDLFTTGGDGAVYNSWWEAASGWQPWFAIHPEDHTASPGAPIAAVWSTAGCPELGAPCLSLFMVDAAGAVWSAVWRPDRGWLTWSAIHPWTHTRPGAAVSVVATNTARIDLFLSDRDGTVRSTHSPGAVPQSPPADVRPNEDLYTLHPTDPRNLQWSEQSARAATIDAIVAVGANVLVMSSWGERSADRWAFWAPMQTSVAAQDHLFTATLGKPLLILPAIESSAATNEPQLGGHLPAYEFADDFPGSPSAPAPYLVVQIEDLIDRYLLRPANPAWPRQWAQMYDRDGTPRYAIYLLHVASNQLYNLQTNPDDAFSQGFDAVAAKVYQDTHVRVGFTLDLLPGPALSTTSTTYYPSPETAGPYLRQHAAVLGVQGFIPEIYQPETSSDQERLLAKRDYLQHWQTTGIPVIMDITPGYDAHIVFPPHIRGAGRYGNNAAWRAAVAALRTARVKGLVFNTWNGYTEGYAAVPTLEYGDANYLWVKELFTAGTSIMLPLVRR